VNKTAALQKIRGSAIRVVEEKTAGLSGCCPDQVADSALRYRTALRCGPPTRSREVR
jgi:hypothetical protein